MYQEFLGKSRAGSMADAVRMGVDAAHGPAIFIGHTHLPTVVAFLYVPPVPPRDYMAYTVYLTILGSTCTGTKCGGAENKSEIPISYAVRIWIALRESYYCSTYPVYTWSIALCNNRHII